QAGGKNLGAIAAGVLHGDSGGAGGRREREGRQATRGRAGRRSSRARRPRARDPGAPAPPPAEADRPVAPRARPATPAARPKPSSRKPTLIPGTGVVRRRSGAGVHRAHARVAETRRGPPRRRMASFPPTPNGG